MAASVTINSDGHHDPAWSSPAKEENKGKLSCGCSRTQELGRLSVLEKVLPQLSKRLVVLIENVPTKGKQFDVLG